MSNDSGKNYCNESPQAEILKAVKQRIRLDMNFSTSTIFVEKFKRNHLNRTELAQPFHLDGGKLGGELIGFSWENFV